MNIIKKMGGWFSAQLNEDGDYNPSPFTLYMATSDTTNYKKEEYEVKYTGSKPILVVCTDEHRMPMKNGKVFCTGNHPVEMLVPMLHFRDAGFTFDIATASGGSVALEMWAYPSKDDNVKSFHEGIKSMMEKPKKLADITSLDDYSAIFIPGGHGCMINLPTNAALGELLHIAHDRGLPTVTLCHGPSTYLSTCTEGVDKEFAYKGYESMCFADRTDAFTPKIGYLPGDMPWKCQESIEKMGVRVVNTMETGAVHQDRELITGDSPNAANNLGKFAAPILVKFAVDNNL